VNTKYSPKDIKDPKIQGTLDSPAIFEGYTKSLCEDYDDRFVPGSPQLKPNKSSQSSAEVSGGRTSMKVASFPTQTPIYQPKIKLPPEPLHLNQSINQSSITPYVQFPSHRDTHEKKASSNSLSHLVSSVQQPSRSFKIGGIMPDPFADSRSRSSKANSRRHSGHSASLRSDKQ